MGLLNRIGYDWNLDMFFLRECTDNKPLAFTFIHLMNKFTFN